MHVEVTQGVKQTNGLMQDLLKSTADNAILNEQADVAKKEKDKIDSINHLT